MDDLAGVHVEFTEREAFALLIGSGVAVGHCKRDPAGFARRIGGSLLSLRSGAFVGARQFQADAMSGGAKLWAALGLSEPPPLGDAARPLTGP